MPRDSTLAYDGGNCDSILDSFKEHKQDEIRRLIDGSSNQSSEMDHIPTTGLKEITSHITPVLQSIVNKLLSQGKYPEKLKIAIFRPLL